MGVFNMRKKALCRSLLGIGLLSMLLSVGYLSAAEHQDIKKNLFNRENILTFIEEKIALEQIHYTEVGVALSGIVYDENLKLECITKKQEEMAEALEENQVALKYLSNSKEEKLLPSKTIVYESGIQRGTIENSGADWYYSFVLKNQKDIHRNAYYTLKLVGADSTYIEALRQKGYDQLIAWEVMPRETFYFKGIIEGPLTKKAANGLKETILNHLKARETNFYQDDLNEATYAYYGYTPYIEEYIIEADRQKSNMQISFKYNELEDQTELIIAFPFYNEPF